VPWRAGDRRRARRGRGGPRGRGRHTPGLPRPRAAEGGAGPGAPRPPRGAAQGAAERASALSGRVEALQLALDALGTGAGADQLAGVDGVLGTLLDLVRIEAGWDHAVEAALGEALNAVVVVDPDATAAALRALRRSHLV